MNLEELLKQDISILEIRDRYILQVLKDNSIKSVGDLANKSKVDLKQLELQQDDIKHISIKLQLQGLDLRDNKKY